MSSVHSTPDLSPASPEHPISPDLLALAASLQEAVQSLLAHAPKEPETPAAATMQGTGKDVGETRSFYFPSASVRMERELLRRYQASSFQELLEKMYALVVGLAKLMQVVHKDVRVRGYVISSLGIQLEHASALVLRMCHVYDKVTPVQD